MRSKTTGGGASGMLRGVGVVLLMLVGGCGQTVLTARDAVVREDGTVILAADLERANGLFARRDLKDHEVRFLVGDGEVGQALTAKYGLAVMRSRVLPDAAGYRAEIAVNGRTLRSTAPLFHWSGGRTIVIVDIDNTLADTRPGPLVLNGQDTASPPLKNSVEVLTTLAEKFHIAYLTARPIGLLEATRDWLNRHHYPPGPVIVAPGMRHTLADARYKRAVIERLQILYPGVLIGIGNTAADAEAYGACGLLTLIIDDEPEDEYGLHSLVMRDWHGIERFFAANAELLADPAALSRTLAEAGTVQLPLQRYNADED